MLELLVDEARHWSVLETIAVVAAIAYLLLAIRQNIGCWIFAGASAAIYVYLFVAAKLYMESALNVFYAAMAVYGWYSWRQGRIDRDSLPVTRWPLQRHLTAILVITAFTGFSGLFLSRHSDAAFPYVDSATTAFALFATYLVARKVLENWWYWLLIDLVSIFVFWQRGLHLTSLLFAIYVILIPIGYLSWRRSMLSAVRA